MLLWAQLPILAALGVWGGHPLPEVALGVAVPTAFALAGTALNSPRGASAAVAGGLIATSVLVVGHSGGSDLSHVHFLLMICAISLYRDRVMLIGSVLVISTYLLVVPPQGSDPTLWVGLGNALVDHSGVLTPPAQLAFERARDLAPTYPAPGFFLGLALARSGEGAAAIAIWRSVLAEAPAEASWRPLVEDAILAIEKPQAGS